MRNLSRIAFAFALTLAAACGEKTQEQIEEECELDPTLPQCGENLECLLDSGCTILNDGECLVGVCGEDGTCDQKNICDAQSSADAVVFMNPNGSAFLGTQYDDSPGFDQFIDAEEAELAAIPEGSCAETEFPDIEGEPTRKSMGIVKVLRDGEVLAEIAPSDSDQPRNEFIFDPGTLNPGDTLDLELTGSPALAASTLLALLTLPPAFPVIAGVDPSTNSFTLTTTMAFTPINVGRVVFRFNFLEGQESVTISCVANGNSGSFAFDTETFARLPPSGSVSMAVFNRTFQFLTATDGIPRTIRGTAQATTNVQYEKP